MIPKRIALKNFLSFGEGPDGGFGAEFVFTEDEPLWILCGRNGIGKSTVFDAITYCLYGEHRGGSHKAEQLVRHGANGFEIEFDFEFAGVEYRIRRTRQRKGRPTQHLHRRNGDDWSALPGNDPAGAVKPDDIEAWVHQTLGLTFKSFTNSVLLRQGEADKLFSASRDERIEVLKGIIGFEEYERLSGRVHNAAGEHKAEADAKNAQLAELSEVTAEELDAGEHAVATAAEAEARDKIEFETAIGRVEQARQWEQLDASRKDLEGKLTAAEERERQSQQIRRDKELLDDLTRHVPAVKELLGIRGRIADLTQTCEASKTRLEQLNADRSRLETAFQNAQAEANAQAKVCDDAATAANALAAEIDRDKKLLGLADEAERLKKKLESEFAADLEEQAAAGAIAEADAEKAATNATSALGRAEANLKQAEDRKNEFSSVEVGVTCSRCGLKVTAEHAERERSAIEELHATCTAELTAARAAGEHADAALLAVRKQKKSLDKSARDKRDLETKWKAKAESCAGLGANPSQLRKDLDDKETKRAAAAAAGSAAAELLAALNTRVASLEVDKDRADGAIAAEQSVQQQATLALADLQGSERTGLAQLSVDWRQKLPALTDADVLDHERELAGLQAAGVTEKFRALELDESKRKEWENQRERVLASIGALAEESRIPERKAKELHEAAKTTADESIRRSAGARQDRDALIARKAEFERVTLAGREAVEKHRLHKRLDDLLGEAGLQRELVRDAEEQIIAFANDTLQHLVGDLSLEEDTTADSKRTFDLRVRRDGGDPIGVAFLSGSQRFRVAVSVALAIGRFAGGRARPLEGVIVDEGFGSLDSEGLQTMAEELKRLQREKALRRVILVSHQPQFAERFPVGYELRHTPAGTLAAPFRKTV